MKQLIYMHNTLNQNGYVSPKSSELTRVKFSLLWEKANICMYERITHGALRYQFHNTQINTYYQTHVGNREQRLVCQAYALEITQLHSVICSS